MCALNKDALYIITWQGNSLGFPLELSFIHGRTGQRRYILGIPVRLLDHWLSCKRRLSHALSSNRRADVRARNVGGSPRRREFDASIVAIGPSALAPYCANQFQIGRILCSLLLRLLNHAICWLHGPSALCYLACTLKINQWCGKPKGFL